MDDGLNLASVIDRNTRDRNRGVLVSNALMYKLSSTNTDRSMKGPVSKIIILIKNKGLLSDTWVIQPFRKSIKLSLERRSEYELTKNLSTVSSLPVMLLEYIDSICSRSLSSKDSLFGLEFHSER